MPALFPRFTVYPGHTASQRTTAGYTAEPCGWGGVVGRPINYQEIPIAAARQQSADVALMFGWFDRVGADADIAALRRDFSEVRWHSFANWAREIDWSVLERTASVACLSPLYR
jgi:hypothetical protein